MNASKNAIRESTPINDLYLDELELKLDQDLENQFSELSFFEHEYTQISNPDALGEVVQKTIWEQITNQLAAVGGEDFIKENNGLNLDLSKDAHYQTTENFEKGIIANHNAEIDYQKRYDDWQSNFKKDENGQVIKKLDKRSGKEKEVLTSDARAPYDKDRPKGSAQEHMDHTVPAAEIIRDPEANAHMTKEEQIAFANSDKNLNPLDAAANESKNDSTMNEWLDSERDGKKPAERFDIDEDKLRQKDKEAREEYEKVKNEGKKRSEEAGKISRRKEALRIGGKALRTAILIALADLLKNIVSKLVAWLKSKNKDFKSFVEQMKAAIKAFVGNLKKTIIKIGHGVATTVATAIFGPIVNTINKIWTLLKQGVASIKEAIDYIRNPENRKKPIGILMLEVGKIVMAGLTAVGAIFLGEAIEKGLALVSPVFAFEIPILGSLASIIGLFLGALVAGIIGAIVINLIDKLIAKKLKAENIKQQVEAGNNVLNTLDKKFAVDAVKLQQTKEKTYDSIKDRHNQAAKEIEDSLKNIYNKDDDEYESEMNKLKDIHF